jgi:HlyD family secretion protein/epimerase transport system membrane fusion protein
MHSPPTSTAGIGGGTAALMTKLRKVNAVAKRMFGRNREAAASSGAATPSDRLRAMLSGTVLVGLGIGGAMFCALAMWAIMAPLASAAVAPGNVNPDSSRKTIQHLEGGIIRAIDVKDGDRVTKGQPLFSLEPLAAKAIYTSKRQQWMRLQVTRARLEAHRANQPAFTPPSFPQYAADADFAKFVRDQVDLFVSRRQNFIEREQILRQQIAQLKQQAEAKTQENASIDKQHDFILEEIEDKRELLSKNLARKPD